MDYFNEEYFENELIIDEFLYQSKVKNVNDLDQEDLDYFYDDKGLCHDQIQSKLLSDHIKKELKNHYPLEFYWNKKKINYRTMPKEVCDKLWKIQMDPYYEKLPKGGAWFASLGGPCELCIVDPKYNYQGPLCMCYKNENSFLCEFHLRYLINNEIKKGIRIGVKQK